MKKILAIMLVLILALSFVTACGGNGGNSNTAGGNSREDNNKPSTSSDGNSDESKNDSKSDEGDSTKPDSNSSGDKFEYGNPADFIANNLKGDYSITYKYTIGGAEESFEITCARTSEGYLYRTMGIEYLYIKNGDKYDMYLGSSAMGYMKIDTMTDEDVLDTLTMFTGFMTSYGDNVSDLKKDGSETIAGRNCDRYTFEADGFGVKVSYIYCIDKATGVCMKFVYDITTAGEAAGLTFECIEFKTSGVTLPDYQ